MELSSILFLIIRRILNPYITGVIVCGVCILRMIYTRRVRMHHFMPLFCYSSRMLVAVLSSRGKQLILRLFGFRETLKDFPYFREFLGLFRLFLNFFPGSPPAPASSAPASSSAQKMPEKVSKSLWKV